ncbi:MAG: GTP-binding protein, partial [Bacillota bacterium]|nr:GTP-binding protein [Bacillota bacterium]
MKKIINLGILAHVDAGKTTLTEAFLMHSGVKSGMG